MKFTRVAAIWFCLAAACVAWAQRPAPPPPPGAPPPGQAGPPGKWWNDPNIVKRLGLTGDQQRAIEELFQRSRIGLIDRHAAVEREEARLEALMDAPQLDDSKILPQIDRIADARAELEKANARLFLGIRHILTPEQWRRLDAGRPKPPPPRPE